MVDDFHQRHLRDRVEVMQASELCRALDMVAQFHQRNRRSIGGQQRVLLHLRFQRLVQRTLGFRVLDDRFDHQVGLGHAVAFQIGTQARGHGGALALVTHLFGEQCLRAFHGRVDEALLTILQSHFEALVGGPRGDVAAHHAGAHHVHMADAGIAATEALQALGQEEDADQVARGRCTGQLHHRAPFGVEAGLDRLAAAALPGADQRVRRRILVLLGLACDLLDHLRRQQRACQPGVGGPGRRALLERARGAGQGQRHGGVEHHRRRHHLVDQADAARGRGRQGAASQHHVHRRRCAHQLRQSRTAAPAREDAQLGLRQADAGAAVIGGHAVAAGQRQLGAATQAVAVDGRHGRAGQLGQLLVSGLATTDGVVDGAAAVELLELLQVRTGNEAGLFQRLDHHALGRVQCNALEQVAQFQQHILRHGIDAAVLTIQGENHHAVVADLGVPVAEAETIEA